MSIPTSRIASIASARTPTGRTPALSTSNRSPPNPLKSPSAIWLRAEFPVQRIKTRFLSLMARLDGEDFDARRVVVHVVAREEFAHTFVQLARALFDRRATRTRGHGQTLR